MIKFNKSKVATKIKLKESEEILDNSIEKEIMEELGIEDNIGEDDIQLEELELDDVDVIEDDLTEDEGFDFEDDTDSDLTEDDLIDDTDSDIELTEDDFVDNSTEDENLEDSIDLTEDDLIDDVDSDMDSTEYEDDIDLTEDDLIDDTDSDIELTEDDFNDFDLEDDEDFDLEDDTEDVLTEEEIDSQIADLEMKKESMKKEGAEMVPSKVLAETKKAMKKMAIDFVQLKKVNEGLRAKLNKLVKENSSFKLDEKKAEAVITILAKSELPKKVKYKIIESVDSARTPREVQVKFNSISKMVSASTKTKTLNKITESVRSVAGKKIENAGLSKRDEYLLGISDEYLESENYMKEK